MRRIAEAFTAADIQAEPVADARVPLWEKFIYLASYAAFSGSARKPAGAIWGDPFVRERFLSAVDEVYAVARAEGVPVARRSARAHRRLHEHGARRRCARRC